MSDSVKRIKAQLEGIKDAYKTDVSSLISDNVSEGFKGLKSRIRNMDIQVESYRDKVEDEIEPRFTKKEIAEKAINTYKKINPKETDKEEENCTPSTHATRTNMKAMAKSLTGMRGSGNAGKQTHSTPNGNGDLGQYTSPANNNDGDLGNNTAYGQYYALTTSMSLEEYEDHINKKFIKEETKEKERTPLVCGVCVSDPCECDNDFDPVNELKERLLTLGDTSWQSIDIIMRQLADELEITPKELHRAFKSEEGMIPDEWLKENREIQICGYMPLDEAACINKVGQVYDVTCMWRGQTMRLKFFWPEIGICSKEECQRACEMFYPGSRLLAHYPCKDEPENYMVIVPPVKESYELIPEDFWMELDEETNEVFQNICEEVGEPQTSPIETTDGMLKVVVESHDTGDLIEIIFENKSGDSSLHDWFSKSKSSDGKPGWVQLGGKYAGKPCARQPGQTSTPKCGSSKMKRNLSKKEEDRAFRRKNRLDPNQPNKSGGAKPTNVKTEEYVDEACWKGYEQKGMKTMFGKRYPNCVKKTRKEETEIQESMKGMSQKSGDKRSTESGAGMTAKGVAKYNRRTGGNLKTAVTTPPSKLKPGSKAAKRRKSFCARSRGWKGKRGKAARRRWNC